jgi:predicted permease
MDSMASRWDIYRYAASTDLNVLDEIRWDSIINSFLIIFILAFLIGNILSKALKRDLTQYEVIFF